MRGMLYTERTSTSSKHLIHYFSLLFLHHGACRILVAWPGTEPVPPAVQVWSPNHWSARKVPDSIPNDLPFSPGHVKKKKRKTNHCVKIMMLRIFLALKNHQTSFIIIVMFITILHTHTKSKKNKLYRPSLLIYKYRGSSRTISLQLLKFKSSFLGNKIRTTTTKNLLKKEVKLILTPHKLMTRCNCWDCVKRMLCHPWEVTACLWWDSILGCLI